MVGGKRKRLREEEREGELGRRKEMRGTRRRRRREEE